MIISVHSFRRGTGKSTVVANLAVLLAMKGHRVGMIDFNFPAPSLHVLFGLTAEQLPCMLNDYIWGDCRISDTVYEASADLQWGSAGNGRLFLVSASSQPKAIARIMRGGYYINLLDDACHSLTQLLNLDLLLVDNYAGLGEETQMAMAICDTQIVILRPDRQDYQGTGVLVEVGRRLEVPRIVLLANEVPARMEAAEIVAEMERAYRCPVAAVLPHTAAVNLMGSAGIFVLSYPDHSFTAVLHQLARNLLT